MSQTSPLRRDALLTRTCPSAHAAFLHRSRHTGVLHVAFFTGAGEGEPGNGIGFASLTASGAWSDPRVLVTDLRYSMQNPVLFDGPDGELHLLHTRQDAGPLGHSQASSDVLHWLSRDDGATWIEQPRVFERGRGAFIRGPIVRTNDQQRVLLPLYFTPGGEFSHERQFSGFAESRDSGRTFQTDALIQIPGTEGAVGVQPNVVRLLDGRLVAFHRNRTELLRHRVGRSVSTDDGRTWSALAPTDLPSNNSSVAAVVLLDGRVVVAFNNSHGIRYPLSLALSSDGGETFSRVVDLTTSERVGGGVPGVANSWLAGEHSYPTMWLDDNALWVAWTHFRETIAIAKLELAFLDQGNGRSSIGLWNPAE